MGYDAVCSSTDPPYVGHFRVVPAQEGVKCISALGAAGLKGLK